MYLSTWTCQQTKFLDNNRNKLLNPCSDSPAFDDRHTIDAPIWIWLHMQKNKMNICIHLYKSLFITSQQRENTMQNNYNYEKQIIFWMKCNSYKFWTLSLLVLVYVFLF